MNQKINWTRISFRFSSSLIKHSESTSTFSKIEYSKKKPNGFGDKEDRNLCYLCLKKIKNPFKKENQQNDGTEKNISNSRQKKKNEKKIAKNASCSGEL